MSRSSIRAGMLLALAGVCGAAAAQPTPPPQALPPPEASHPLDTLLAELDDLRSTVDALRRALALAKLETAEIQRERDELWQFIQDHDQLGRDFEQYEAIKAATELQERRRLSEASREQHEAARLKRTARQRAARADRDRRRDQMQRVQRYRDAGFTPLGFDVYLSDAAFNYRTDDGLSTRLDWNGLTGHFIRVYPWADRIDFSSMTLSGSVLNASEIVRDIGIAVTFFDEQGSQVGGEIIQVSNARPDVPYPFTTTLDMALNRPFASTTTYVLYADPSDPAAVP